MMGLILVLLFYSPLLVAQSVTYNSSTQIAPPQRYAFLPYNCSGQGDVPCVQYLQCLTCVENTTKSNSSNCTIGNNSSAQCTYPATLSCTGEKQFTQKVACLYCFQVIPLSEGARHQNTSDYLPGRDYVCANFTGNESIHCPSVATPAARFISQCRVLPHVSCLGNRTFFVLRPCSHTSGYKRSTAFILSVLLGGLGIDRFYLQHWGSGVGKFISFGGLGVWTLLDILFIGTGYLQPNDESLYV